MDLITYMGCLDLVPIFILIEAGGRVPGEIIGSSNILRRFRRCLLTIEPSRPDDAASRSASCRWRTACVNPVFNQAAGPADTRAQLHRLRNPAGLAQCCYVAV